MFKHYFKIALVSAMALSITILFSSFTAADVKIPDKVRIGLYYTDPSAGVKGAVSTLNVSAPMGIQLGYDLNGSFNVLYEEPSGSNVSIRKDSYYIRTNNTFSETTANASNGGTVMGPYHIKIGGDYPDLNSVNQKVSELQQQGIAAFPAYVDSWQTWTGCYSNVNSAQTDLKSNLQTKLPNTAFTIVQPSSDRIVAAKSTGDTALIFGSDKAHFQIYPKPENTLYALKINNNSTYRGAVEIRRFSGSDMTVINVLPLEEYLYGVVPSEMESSSNIEALKAQAVAARTFTVNGIGRHSKLAFDLCPTTADQVYKGYMLNGKNSEAKSTNKAVDETRGKILVYNGRPAQIYYFSSSGGKTEDVKNVWNSDLPYLKSVDDPYESGKSYKYNWEVNIPASKVKEIAGAKLGDITGIQITKVSDAGRATEVVITGTKDKRTYLRGNCRTIFSGTDYALFSQWYTVTSDADISVSNGSETVKTQIGSKNIMTSDGVKKIQGSGNKVTVVTANGSKNVSLVPTIYKFQGKGWGHGIGMSQEGAKGFANAGYTYDQILMHYFTGTNVQ